MSATLWLGAGALTLAVITCLVGAYLSHWMRTRTLERYTTYREDEWAGAPTSMPSKERATQGAAQGERGLDVLDPAIAG